MLFQVQFQGPETDAFFADMSQFTGSTTTYTASPKKKNDDGVTLVSPSEKKNHTREKWCVFANMMAMKSFWTAVLIEVSWGFAQDGGLVPLSQCRVKYTSIWRTMLNEATV